MSERQRRYIPADQISLRAQGDPGGERKITGLVAPFNRWSPVYGGGNWKFRERIDPAFFDDVLDQDIASLFNHDPNFLMGRTSAGTLKVWVDEDGLKMDNPLSSSQTLRDLVVIPMDRRELTGASFSFYLPEGPGGEVWEQGEDGIGQRTLLKARRVDDVGPVTFPWYTDSSVGVNTREQRAAVESGVEAMKRWQEDGDWRAANLALRHQLLREQLRT